jgi:hypothetical protein
MGEIVNGSTTLGKRLGISRLTVEKRKITEKNRPGEILPPVMINAQGYWYDVEQCRTIYNKFVGDTQKTRRKDVGPIN